MTEKKFGVLQILTPLLLLLRKSPLLLTKQKFAAAKLETNPTWKIRLEKTANI